jgi:hypothetical protein
MSAQVLEIRVVLFVNLFAPICSQKSQALIKSPYINMITSSLNKVVKYQGYHDVGVGPPMIVNPGAPIRVGS